MPQKTSVNGDALEIRIPCPELEQALAEFFACLRREGDEAHFHPHPLTPEEASRRCSYQGKDLYYLLLVGRQVVGYGMLRGWDEGYDIPSLGIAIRRSARSSGLASLLMGFLHTAARLRGASKVILKVDKDNPAAIRLYENLGYTFTDKDDRQLLGSMDL